jgi:hypothetical protein
MARGANGKLGEKAAERKIVEGVLLCRGYPSLIKSYCNGAPGVRLPSTQMKLAASSELPDPE